ncbi:hypothetical protein TWF103_009485 [Orbilia oligospora]|nr:hypothetical protein TWF103_009485 [Orbilia oligospora]
MVILSILSTRATLAIGGEVSKLEPISTSTRPAQRVSGGSWISQSWKESVRVLKSRGQAYRTRNSCRIGEYRVLPFSSICRPTLDTNCLLFLRNRQTLRSSFGNDFQKRLFTNPSGL